MALFTYIDIMLSSQIPIYTIESLQAAKTKSKEFNFFRFEYFARDIQHLKAPHRHNFYTFIFVTGGSGSHTIDFKKYDLKPGRIFLIAPGQVHAWIALRKVSGFVVLFNDSFMALSKGRKIMSAWPLFRIHQPNFFDLTLTEQEAWNAEFLYMENEVKQQDEFTRDALFYSVSTLLVRASRLTTRTNFKNNKDGVKDFLFLFQELIDKNFLLLKTPKEYAAKMNITPNYLNSLCKKKSGKSAGELIRQRVLLEAKRSLAHTQLSVAEIAFHLGFQDNSYFGRYFKKYTKQTPESFRSRQNQ
jgi:AraC-like DNA-binding protein